MRHTPDILAALDGFSRARIGVLGDLMVDRFIYGDALRISPEAPVPVVAIRRRTTQPGGAANVASNVVSLSGHCTLFGILGADQPGQEVLAELIGLGCDVGGVQAPAGYESTVKTRVVAGSQQLVRIDEEHTQAIGAETERAILDVITQKIGELDVFVISDYAKGVVTLDLAASVIKLCNERGVRVVVDPKPVNLLHYAGADVIKPNMTEALRFVGAGDRPGDWSDMQAVCREVRALTGARAVVLTAGGHGMYVLDESRFTHIPGHPRGVFDVAGAGDSTLAAIALGLAGGLSLPEAAAVGNLAGSLAVGKLGVAAILHAELREEVAAHYVPAF